MFIIQRPVMNTQLNEMLKDLKIEDMKPQSLQLAPKQFFFQTSMKLKDGFSPLQLSFDDKLLVIQNSHQKYPDFISLKFISGVQLFTILTFQNSTKQYRIEKDVQFSQK